MNPALKESHIPVLDGVRGLAILMVLLFHFWQGVLGYFYPPVFPGIFALWGHYESIGQKGVDLFFVLSGFLITGILLRTKGSAHYFKNFYIRRSLRIFPLYFVVVLVCLAAGTAFSLPPYQWSQIWSYVVYLQNVVLAFWPASIGGPQHFWSLAVEEQFYLFWPLAVFWLSRRQLLWLAMFLVLAAWGARAACLQVSWDCAFFFTFCRVDTLAVGALLAIFFSEPARWQPIAVWTRRLAVPIVLVVAATYVGVAGNPGRFFADTRSTVYAMFFGAVLVWSLSPGAFNPLPGVFRGSWLRGLGRISYGMYVFHPFIFHKIMGRFYAATWSPVRGHLWASLTVEWFVCLGGTILVAWTSWVFFEHPFIRLKHRFEYETGVPASLSKVGATEPGKP